MALSPYNRVCDALRDELQLSPNRKFKSLLAKAKVQAGAQGIPLSEEQKSALFQIYLDAKQGKHATDPRDRNA